MYTYKWSERDRTTKLSLNNSGYKTNSVCFVMDVSRVY